MIIHNCEQQSVEWGQLRAGIVTASEFDQLVTPKFEIRKGQMPKTYLAAKLAEWWLGGPLISACVWDMDQGKILEEEARPWLALELSKPIQAVGFITSDDGSFGCSPDGLIGCSDGGCAEGVEIKCPQPVNHVKALIAGEVPDEYLPQIHGGMFVTGFDSWKFVSYRRGFPNLVVTVRRDYSIQGTLRDALDAFLSKLAVAKERMIDLNGGPPKRLTFERQAEAPFVSEIPS